MATKDDLARRIWPVLVGLARRRQREIFYIDLARRIKHGSAQLSAPLGLIQSYCEEAKKPPLTILVIGKDSGQPKSGFTAWDVADLGGGVEAVFREQWTDENPFEYAANGTTQKKLVERLAAGSDPGSVFAQVLNRGIRQVLFRSAVRDAYKACAICGLSWSACLQAAHIIPYRDSSPYECISLKNGLLLCANHHLMFDRHEITITPDGLVEFAFLESWLGYSDQVKNLTVNLHERKAFFPEKEFQRPDAAYLRTRYEAFLSNRKRKKVQNQRAFLAEDTPEELIADLEATARGRRYTRR